MKIVLDYTKTVEQNAEKYFEASKKAKKKLAGAEKAHHNSILKWDTEKSKVKVEKQGPKKIVRLAWYEKFHWCYSSEGHLMIGGRDSTTNEVIIKKHAEKDDIVLHTDMAGSPFVVIKAEGKKISEKIIKEGATLCLAHSKAWKLGIGGVEVFYVKPEQVTKQPNPGEFLPKGAFVIRGDTTYIDADINFAVGVIKIKEETKIMGGPKDAVIKNCEKNIEIVPGDLKKSDIARKIRVVTEGTLDEIIRVIPAGGCDVKKERRRKK